jgi:hypothetical protein
MLRSSFFSTISLCLSNHFASPLSSRPRRRRHIMTAFTTLPMPISLSRLSLKCFAYCFCFTVAYVFAISGFDYISRPIMIMTPRLLFREAAIHIPLFRAFIYLNGWLTRWLRFSPKLSAMSFLQSISFLSTIYLLILATTDYHWQRLFDFLVTRS